MYVLLNSIWFTYHRVHAELEAEERRERDADEVVAADVDEGDERLPAGSDGHA